MVLFGTARSGENEVKRALSCAVDMQIEMDRINKEYRSEGLPELYMGIGINTGEVMAGMLGSDLYSAYTVIGDEVNLASRIEAFSLRGQVLISQNTFDRCRDFVKTGDPMEVYVKGKSNRVTMHEVLGIPSESRELPRQEIRRSVRVEVKLPLVFHIVHGKIVLPEARQGTILDIGYHGILIEVAQPIPLHTDLKVAFDLPLVGFRVENLWAKVVKVKDAEGRHLAGLEFTSIGAEEKSKLQLFVQLLIQGSDNK
jgi:adenylate cyclase